MAEKLRAEFKLSDEMQNKPSRSSSRSRFFKNKCVFECPPLKVILNKEMKCLKRCHLDA